jgi:hypothetical protein
MCLGKSAGNRIHLRLSLLERDSRTQSSDSVEIAVVTSSRIENFRYPEIHGIADPRDTQIEIGAEGREMHLGQSDADDERRRCPNAGQIDDVDVQNSPDEIGVRSEAPLPQAAADDDLGPSTAPVRRRRSSIVRTERVTHQRDVENLEELRRDVKPAQSLASVAFDQIDRPPSVSRDGLE